jgi:hypothetical protein
MINHKKYIISVIIIVIFLFACSCSNDGQNEASVTPDISPVPSQQADNDSAHAEPIISGEVTVTFNYENQSGWASNQFAVWVENINGSYINTLYATGWTARGGYENRPDSIALWVEKSNLASMQKSDVDAIAGATPKSGTLSYYWDLKDTAGDTVPPGEYKIFVEGTLRWKNHVIYSGVITVGGTSNGVIMDAEYFYEANEQQDALTSGSQENAMITYVTAGFTPSD